MSCAERALHTRKEVRGALGISREKQVAEGVREWGFSEGEGERERVREGVRGLGVKHGS